MAQIVPKPGSDVCAADAPSEVLSIHPLSNQEELVLLASTKTELEREIIQALDGCGSLLRLIEIRKQSADQISLIPLNRLVQFLERANLAQITCLLNDKADLSLTIRRIEKEKQANQYDLEKSRRIVSQWDDIRLVTWLRDANAKKWWQNPILFIAILDEARARHERAFQLYRKASKGCHTLDCSIIDFNQVDDDRI